MIAKLIVAVILLAGVADAAESPPVNSERELLNERRARIELQIRVKDFEIKELVDEYKQVVARITEIDAVNKKTETPAPAKKESK
jgi:hypothetical protein